jgi:uncharacterized protein (DUF2236 family)
MFSEASSIRRVHRERALVLYGPRALLMQAAHPEAVKGLLSHSSALEAPYERLARTAQVMDVVHFGTREEAERVTRRVRAMHRRAGVDRPDWLLWVLFTLYDSALVVYRRYVGPIDPDELWADYREVGRLFGLSQAQMPEDVDAYRREMLEGGVIGVSDWARTRAKQIVLEPPLPWVARPLVETFNFVTIGLLPDRIREEYGFSPLPPAIVRKALVMGGAEYVKRVLIPLLPDQLRVVPAARAA